MKKKLLFLVAILCIFTLSVFGCGGIDLGNGPKASDTVYGNGGVAVVKGNYLYFANAYLDYNQIGSNDNKFDSEGAMQKRYGIYRTKLNASGVVELNSNGVPVGAELLVPQVGGYSDSGIYICGEYLYYTTPYSGYKTGSSDLTKGLLRFERVTLNGQDHTILSEGEFTTDCKYSVNYIGNTTYISILSGSKITIIKVKANGDTSKSTIDSVKDYCVEEQTTLVYNKAVNDVNKYVYFTKTDADENYSLYRKPLSGGATETLIPASTEAIEIVAVKNNRVYFKQADKLKSAVPVYDKENKVTTGFDKNEVINYASAFNFAADAKTGIVDYLILDDTYGFAQNRGIIAVYTDGSNYSLIQFKADGTFKNIVSGTKQYTLEFTEGSNVYYQIAESDALYSFDYEKEDAEQQEVISSFTTTVKAGETEESIVDFDANRVFFFSKAKNSNEKYSYLHVALLSGNYFEDADGNSVAQYVGVLDSADVKKEK